MEKELIKYKLLLKFAENEIEKLKAIIRTSVPVWNLTQERLPKLKQKVLCRDEEGYFTIGHVDFNCFNCLEWEYDGEEHSCEITEFPYWMELGRWANTNKENNNGGEKLEKD